MKNPMCNRLLQGGQFQDKTRIAIITEKIIGIQFLFVLLSFFLISFCSTAQEYIQVGAAKRQMIVYVPSGIEQSRPLVIFIQVMKQTMHNQKNVCQPIKTINNFK